MSHGAKLPFYNFVLIVLGPALHETLDEVVEWQLILLELLAYLITFVI